MLNWFLFVIYLMCILFLREWILHECGCLPRQKKVVGPLDLKQRQLRAPQLVLGTEPGSSAGATSTLDFWAISSPCTGYKCLLCLGGTVAFGFQFLVFSVEHLLTHIHFVFSKSPSLLLLMLLLGLQIALLHTQGCSVLCGCCGVTSAPSHGFCDWALGPQLVVLLWEDTEP